MLWHSNMQLLINRRISNILTSVFKCSYTNICSFSQVCFLNYCSSLELRNQFLSECTLRGKMYSIFCKKFYQGYFIKINCLNIILLGKVEVKVIYGHTHKYLPEEQCQFVIIISSSKRKYSKSQSEFAKYAEATKVELVKHCSCILEHLD